MLPHASRVCGDGLARPAPSRPPPRPRRQVDLAPLRAARRRWPPGSRACRTTRPAPTAGRRSPACRRSGRRSRRPGRRRHSTGTRFGRLAFTRRPARRRQLRARRCGCWRACWPASPFTATLVGDASLSRRPMRRVIEPLTRMGARIDSTDGHAPLTVHGATAARHCLRAGHSERAGEERRPARRPARRAATTSVTEPAQTRDHTERALRRVRDRRSGRRPHGVGRRAASAPTAQRSRRARRLLVRGVLDGRGGGAARAPASTSTTSA